MGIDLLLVLIDWYEEEGGDVQREKKIGTLQGKSPQEMVLSVGIKILSPPKI